MAAERQHQHTSTFQLRQDPTVLSEIFDPHTSVAAWQRTPSNAIEHYFASQSERFKIGIREIYSIESLAHNLNHRLPEGSGKQATIDEIFMLADMLTCLFDSNQVGMRLVTLSSAMCPKFHVDNIPVRLVCTYLGHGTEWLPNESLHNLQYPADTVRLPEQLVAFAQQSGDVQQLKAFDVGLLKGSAWSNSIDNAAIHRSCEANADNERVLLTLDPM